jgi:xanthine dehydrogenase/oxidase
VLQIAADALNIPLSKVFLSETRTDTVANTSATAASVSSDINGMAVLHACQQIMERLKPLQDQHPDYSWEKIVKTAYFERINLSANGFYKTPDLTYDWATNKGRMFSYFTYGAACTEVEIDTLTGDHLVLSSHLIMDIGRPINPAIDVGQIEGAFTQGLGWCTIEEPLVSPTTGFLFTRGPGLYKIPGFKDIPVDFRVTVMDGVRNTRAIHSSKAVGEPPLFLGASCFFAIRDAIKYARKDQGLNGPYRMDSPATSERIRLHCADPFVERAKTPLKAGEKPWAVPL